MVYILVVVVVNMAVYISQNTFNRILITSFVLLNTNYIPLVDFSKNWIPRGNLEYINLCEFCLPNIKKW